MIQEYAERIRARMGDAYQASITVMQQRLRPRLVVTPRTQREFIRVARWWELEAMRGYDNGIDEYGMNSSHHAMMYGANMRWCAELLADGHRIAGMRFDRIVAQYAQFPWDEFVRRHAERILGRPVQLPRKRHG